MAITTATGEGPPNGLPGDPGSTYNRTDGPPFLYRRFAGGWVAADIIGEDGLVNTNNLPAHSHPESDLNLADNTTSNASASQHGLLPKLANTGTQFLRDDGTWQTAGGGSHASTHQNGGGDEINVAGLSGLLADAQTPTAHTHTLADITNEGALAAKNTVATADIDNDAVTYAKIQNVTDARLLGRSAGSSGDAQEITVGSGLSLSGGALTATGGGGGGVSQLIVNLISDGANVAWSNMPSAVTFFAGSHRFATKVDLSDYTECRLIVNKQATAGAAASIVRLRYITAFSTTVGNWLQIGASSVQVAVNVQNTVLDSGWIALAAGAQADVFITLDGSGGDGVLDPGFGVISAQFR